MVKEFAVSANIRLEGAACAELVDHHARKSEGLDHVDIVHDVQVESYIAPPKNTGIQGTIW